MVFRFATIKRFGGSCGWIGLPAAYMKTGAGMRAIEARMILCNV